MDVGRLLNSSRSLFSSITAALTPSERAAARPADPVRDRRNRVENVPAKAAPEPVAPPQVQEPLAPVCPVADPLELLNGCEARAGGVCPAREGAVVVALAGQPNVGKSTVFNLLTGLSQHVGNWPGKTVEQKTGSLCYDGLVMQLVDLPGTYSLTANSPEEQVARDYIIREQPDIVVVVVDAAILERSLYLLAEIMHLPVPVVLGLNMVDVARQQGLRVDTQILEAALGIPVVPMVASRNQGVRELLQKVTAVIRGEIALSPHRPAIREDHRAVLTELLELAGPYIPAPYPPGWVALKLLEGDSEITRLVREQLPAKVWSQVEAILHQHEDAVLAVAGGRYDWIGRMVRAAVARPRAGRVTLTERLDRIATHPLGGLVVLASVLGLVFWLTYTVGAPLQEWLDRVVVQGLAGLAGRWLAGAPAWVSGLVVDGVIGGAGTMLTFSPILVIFFAAMGFLEDVGYMARAAYSMDRFMHQMGLHGKSFMPLFLGFGCNVPAVMGTRIVDEPRARLLTILLAPLVPCTARMAVVAVLAPIFFGPYALWVSWGLVLFSLLVLAVLGAVLNRILFKGERAAFIMEMPLYHLPNWRTIGLGVGQRLLSFLRKAGTVILAVSIVVWMLATLPYGQIDTSILATVGRGLAPVGALMGLDWRMMVALLTSFIAKENAVATLGVLYGTGEKGLAAVLAGQVSLASGLAFMVVTMLFIPCIATLAAMRQETGSWKWPLLGMTMQMALSFGFGALAYHLVRLLAG
jgi:ferrous iron transport protein B